MLEDYIFDDNLRYQGHKLIYTFPKPTEEPIVIGGILGAAILCVRLINTDEQHSREIVLDEKLHYEPFYIRYEQEVIGDDWGYIAAELEYEELYYVACISMEDHLDNSALIDLATDYIVDVCLSDQLFRKDNQWYTLCLLFNLDDFTGTPLEGAIVKTLSCSSYYAGTNTLTMDFSDNLTAIEAGKPYIVKWTEGEDIIFPMFAGVTVSTDAADVQTTYADFIGTYNYIDYAEEDRSVLLLIGDALEYPEEGAHNIACSAYFRLKEGLGAGEPMRIVLNFNESTQVVNLSADEQQIIKFIKDGKLYIHRGGKIYTATGQKVK